MKKSDRAIENAFRGRENSILSFGFAFRAREKANLSFGRHFRGRENENRTLGRRISFCLFNNLSIEC